MAKARFGLTLYPLDARMNQTAQVALGFADADLGGTTGGGLLQPVEDNLRLVNHATVTRKNGGTADVQRTEGPYATTGPGSPGDYQTAPTVNVQSDSVLPARAGWLVNVGTADQDRYPTLSINLRRRPALAAAWLPATVGSRITADQTYPTEGQPPDVIVEGWTESLSRFVWDAAVNTSPAEPYTIGVVGQSHVDTVGSTLAADLAAGGSSATVTAADTDGWATDPSNFPVDLNLGGYQITCTAVAGSSPSFTLTLDPATVTDDVAAGADVRLWTPARVALEDT